MNLSKLFLLMITVTIISCASTKKIMPTEKIIDESFKNDEINKTNVNETSNTNQNMSNEAFNRGKTLYETHCGNCHDLLDPKAFTEEQWVNIVPSMVHLVNENSVVIDDQSKEDILKYVLAMRLM
jgi:hypothetical protein